MVELLQFKQLGLILVSDKQPRRSNNARATEQPRYNVHDYAGLRYASFGLGRFGYAIGHAIMKVALMGFWVGLYGAGLSVGSHLVSLDAATWGELSGTLIGFTLLITVITRGLASPDRPRSFNRSND